jgi:phage/plasmid-like protein (TIGR03299 family)
MAHDISFNGSGQAEIVLRNDPAWHGLGTVFKSESGNRLTSEKIEELCPSIFFPVEKRPMFLAGEAEPIPGYYATVRTDTGKALGVVRERYTVYQNREAFAFLDSLVLDGILEYESAMALNGGAKVVLLARLPEVSTVGSDDDTILRHLLLSTTHDGSGAVDIFPTNTRVVCANTLRLALDASGSAPYRATVKHTGSMRAALTEAASFIASAEVAFGNFADNANLLCNRACSGEQARQFVAELFPAPTDAAGTPIEKGNKATIYSRKLDEIRYAIKHPSNALPAMRGTWWQMLNAVTFVVDHKSRTRAKNDRARAENRFENSIYGKGSDLKAKAMELALAMSA